MHYGTQCVNSAVLFCVYSTSQGGSPDILLPQDSSYHQQRSKYSILLSHGKPVEGGCWTHFADTRRAYQDLPQETKDELEDLIVEHEYA